MNKKKELIYSGKRISVYKAEKSIKGKNTSFDLVEHPGASVILAFDDKKKILFIENSRIAVGKKLLELPAGVIESGEDPFTTAKRELQEETGCSGKDWISLFSFFTSPGFCNEKIFAFAASNLTYSAQQLDESEEITVVPLAIDEALDKIKKGEIEDGKTISTLLFWKAFYL